MTAKKNRKAPALVAYHVVEGDNPQWTRIGAAWDHDDAKGLTLQLEMLPIGFNGRIVLREAKPKTEAGA